MTRAEIVSQIEDISRELKGTGVYFSERLALNEERKSLRVRFTLLVSSGKDSE